MNQNETENFVGKFLRESLPSWFLPFLEHLIRAANLLTPPSGTDYEVILSDLITFAHQEERMSLYSFYELSGNITKIDLHESPSRETIKTSFKTDALRQNHLQYTVLGK